jgi:hypothetical protein
MRDPARQQSAMRDPAPDRRPATAMRDPAPDRRPATALCDPARSWDAAPRDQARPQQAAIHPRSVHRDHRPAQRQP